MDSQLTTMLQSYLIESGIDPRAAGRITAGDILENVRELEESLVQQAVEAEGTMPTPEESSPEKGEGEEEGTAIVDEEVTKPTSPALPEEVLISNNGIPTSPSPTKAPAPSPDAPASPSKKRSRSSSSSADETPSKRPRVLSRLASLTPAARVNPSIHYTFLSNNLVYISYRFASACVWLTRQRRIGEALDIGQFAVNFIGPDAWSTAVQIFEMSDEGVVGEIDGVKKCLGDCLREISGYRRDEGRRLHRVMANCAMHEKKEMNVQG